MPFWTRISITSAAVRISTPAAFAADAIACVTAPIPPAANDPEPAGCDSPAARMNRTSARPADPRPIKVQNTPTTTITTPNESVGTYYDARPATSIGPQHSRPTI